MISLLWPGDHRAGGLMSAEAILRALVYAEDRWLHLLTEADAAPEYVPLADLVTEADLPDLARNAEFGGNPVIPLVALLRARLRAAGHHDAAAWLHRGLTSQDVLDTAVQLCSRDAVARLQRELHRQTGILAELAATHRTAVMVARTLTQHAVPTTFGTKAATWLHAVLDAADTAAELTFPVQLGGAAGTLSAVVELLGTDRARACRAGYPAALNLAAAAPWHTRRAPITRLGDAAVSVTDAYGRIANDVLTLSRPEIGELAEAVGGGSSTMPHKANPTLSVLVRRTALAAPMLGATLHSAAAEQLDERADGAWHAEWATLADLLRRTVVAAAQTTELLAGLRVDTARMAQRVREAEPGILAEQMAMAAVNGQSLVPGYRGLVDDLIDEALTRARTTNIGDIP